MFRPVGRPVGRSSLLLQQAGSRLMVLQSRLFARHWVSCNCCARQALPHAHGAAPTEERAAGGPTKSGWTRVKAAGERAAPSLINAAEQPWAACSQESRSAHYKSERRRRASDPFAERARRQREYERERSTQAGIERHRASARATRTRQQDEDAARATGLTQLYSDADRLLEYQHRCSGAPISAN